MFDDSQSSTFTAFIPNSTMFPLDNVFYHCLVSVTTKRLANPDDATADYQYVTKSLITETTVTVSNEPPTPPNETNEVRQLSLPATPKANKRRNARKRSCFRDAWARAIKADAKRAKEHRIKQARLSRARQRVHEDLCLAVLNGNDPDFIVITDSEDDADDDSDCSISVSADTLF
ncbi:hypothetical protein CPB83DRAFT_899330 [Crepidotus variabilis]|uniref:Uncharacterized protein n=1 Tax=Crepidotus variabilis TaxID=179855 RepID=A0A9P6JJ19_9AGAR|nr:hypothetical protein CPB83DRAFT_899330 [Crepidotus variabilis]